MKRFIAVAVTGIFLNSLNPATIWADIGGGATKGSPETASKITEPGGTGKDILHKDLGTKDDSIKNKLEDVKEPLKRSDDLPIPGKVFED